MRNVHLLLRGCILGELLQNKVVQCDQLSVLLDLVRVRENWNLHALTRVEVEGHLWEESACEGASAAHEETQSRNMCKGDGLRFKDSN
jgi:hypothetical protein